MEIETILVDGTDTGKSKSESICKDGIPSDYYTS